MLHKVIAINKMILIICIVVVVITVGAAAFLFNSGKDLMTEDERTEMLLDKLKKTEDNDEFLETLKTA